MRKRGLIYGRGKVDVDYPCQIFEDINGKRVQTFLCPYYEVWKQMLRRVFSEKLHENFPTYVGSSVCEEWLSLAVFKDWMVRQKWKEGEKKLQLDKDFLVKGNKHYCPERCLFVPHSINSFCKQKPAFAEGLPLGVCRDSTYPDKYEASCSDPFKRYTRHLGYFTCPSVAHEAWRKKKHKYANELADSSLCNDERLEKVLRRMYKLKDHNND